MVCRKDYSPSETEKRPTGGKGNEKTTKAKLSLILYNLVANKILPIRNFAGNNSFAN